MKLHSKHILGLKVFIHLCALLPLFYTYFKAFSDQLGADPIQEILHFTGVSAFNLLLLSLLVSPLAKYLKQGQLVNVRRLLGLYAFTYALVHFTSYLLFDLQLEWILLFSEIIKRPYITVGFSALLILSTLAATSTKALQRRMGSNWQKTHNWVYLAVLLVALHYFWSVKSELVQPLLYCLMVLILLSSRHPKWRRALKQRKLKGQKKQQNKIKLA